MSDIALRTTVADIVKRRNETLKHYQAAYDAIQDAKAAIKLALTNGFQYKATEYYHICSEIKKKMGIDLQNISKVSFMDSARRVVDVEAWAYIMEYSTLERYMDSKAKSQLKQHLIADPPECTEETVLLTCQSMAMDAGMMFRRGLAEAFSSLDHRFKSHDGWKIGSRAVITNAVQQNYDYRTKVLGFSWNYNHRGRDIVHDVERVLRQIKGLPPVETRYDGVTAQVERELKLGEPMENEYIKIRGFKNGNIHLWFTDKDLLWQVNKLLAEYYGEVMSSDRTDDGREESFKHIPKMSLVKGLAYFPTPDKLAQRIVEEHLCRRLSETGVRVLEPSAGTGAFVRAILNKYPSVDVTAIEYDSERCQELREIDNVKVIQSDFLQMTPDSIGKFDVIVMNPPFNFGEDITHVTHASKFLKEGGMLISIMSAGTATRSDKNANHFMKQVTGKKVYDPGEISWSDRWQWLPAGSFSEVGTNVNTILVKIYKEFS
jgi:predicted RNA methylase